MNWIIILILEIIAHIECIDIKAFDYTILKNKQGVSGEVISVVDCKSVIQCAVKCTATEGCTHANFLFSSQCELLHGSAGEEIPISDETNALFIYKREPESTITEATTNEDMTTVDIATTLQPEPSCEDTLDLITDILDSDLTASSHYDSYYLPRFSRLNIGYAWAPRYGVGEWIKADLGENRIVVPIRTRGRESNYVNRFNIATSVNDVDWSFVVDDFGATVVFSVFAGPNTVFRNPLLTPVETRYVRLTIVAYVGNNPNLSWAIDGCLVLTD